MINEDTLIDYCINDNIIEFVKHLDHIEEIKCIKDHRGRNLLIIACFNHSYKIVDLLLELGFDINSTNNNGTSVLMFAKTKVYENKNYAFLQMLINKGANVNHRDNFNKNIKDYIIETSDVEMENFINQYFEGRSGYEYNSC